MIWFLALPIVLVVVLLWICYTHFHGYQLDHTVKVGDLLGTINAIILAIVLQISLARRGKKEEAARSLISNAIDEFAESVGKLQGVVEDAIGKAKPEEKKWRAIITGFEDCQILWSLLESATYESAWHKKLDEYCNQLDVLLRLYKGRITGGNFPNRKITFADREQAGYLKKDIMTAVIKLKIELNRC